MSKLEKINDSQENLSTPVEDLLKQAVSEEKSKKDLPKDKKKIMCFQFQRKPRNMSRKLIWMF